jgi:NADH-quinone oxidoreductase subunit J
VQAVAFYILALVSVAAAFLVITAKNPVHSVLYLITVFFSAAGLFVLLGAEFLAMLLVVVYVGAVAVLFLFVVMMLDVDFAQFREGFARYLPLGGVVGAVLLTEIILVAMTVAHTGAAAKNALPMASAPGVSNTEAIGQVLYTDYFYLFQASGLVLLVAMIGAIVLTLRHKVSVKRQDINVQNARTPAIAMSVRKVASGQGLQDADAAEWVQ